MTKRIPGRSFIVPLRPMIDEPVTVTSDMLTVLRHIKRGGFEVPIYRSHYYKAWNAVCHFGFVGYIKTLMGGYHVVTPIGKLALAQAEQQMAATPEQCLMNWYAQAR